jgi:two-component system OmpR family sensor kinase
MASSLRRRLQIWYGLVLCGLIVTFGILLYGRVRQMQLSRVDVELVAVVDYLNASLRAFPPPLLDETIVPPDDAPPLPPEHRIQQLYANLDFPETTGVGRTGTTREDWYFIVTRSNGKLLKQSENAPTSSLPADRLWPRDRPVLLQDGQVRQALMVGPQDVRILVGKSMHAELAATRWFGLQLLGTGLAVLAVGLAGGWWISGRLVRPIHQISVLAESVSEKNLSQRIETEAIDEELVGLANTLNVTFDRLEKAFAQQAQLTADASHELRTPLSVMRTQAELTLSRPRTVEEYRNALTSTLNAARQMTKLVDGLMTLARADAGQMTPQFEPVDFQQLVSSTVEQLKPLAFSKEVRLNLSVSPAIVQGNSTNLSRVVTNLVSNAIYYNRPHGKIDVQLKTEGDTVRLVVRDTGKGIPEESRDQLFNRFYRADKSRARTSGGHGLGLAITKAIVEAHGGYIDFTSEEDTGTTFRVTLPKAG